MDKSFNDQELSDIMKEIEALEDEFQSEPVATQKSEETEIDTEVVGELAHMSEEEAIPKTNKSETQVLHFEKPVAKEATKHSTAMSFKVQGDLNLELFFEVGGKTIALEVTEAGLDIQMEGGVTFHVPVTSSSTLKKAI